MRYITTTSSMTKSFHTIVPSNETSRSPDTTKNESITPASMNLSEKKRKNEFVILAHQSVAIALGDSIFEAIGALPDFRLILLDIDPFSENSGISNQKNAQQVDNYDVQLFLSTQLDVSIKPLLTSLKAGCVPIVPTIKKIKDVVAPFDPVKETGNAFFYQRETVWNIFAALIQAREAHRFPYDWENLVEACRAV